MNVTEILKEVNYAGAYGNIQYCPYMWQADAVYLSGIMILFSVLLILLLDRAYGKERKIDIGIFSILREWETTDKQKVYQYIIDRALTIMLIFGIISILYNILSSLGLY